MYVDDLSALTRGPRQTVTALWFLFAAGHCAGLYTETHACGWTRFHVPPDRLRRLLAPLPVRLLAGTGPVPSTRA
eukprot:14724686-Alexandrium_andersonii.AAC.1